MERNGGHDDNGIVWPEAIAPYRVCVVPIGGGKSAAGQYLQQKAKELCRHLEDNIDVIDGDDILLEDRSHRVSPGMKLKEASLIGFPWVVVLGKTALPESKDVWEDEQGLDQYLVGGGGGTVEIQERATGMSVQVPYGEVGDYFKHHARCRTPVELLNEGFELFD